MISSNVLCDDKVLLYIHSVVVTNITMNYYDQVPGESRKDKGMHEKFGEAGVFVTKNVLQCLTEIFEQGKIVSIVNQNYSYDRNGRRLSVERLTFDTKYMDDDDFGDAYRPLVEFVIEAVLADPMIQQVVEQKLMIHGADSEMQFLSSHIQGEA